MSLSDIDQRLKGSALRNLDPKTIQPNPENPRIIFRQEEMESLLISIDQNGVQVPITVYKDGSGYVLIDGERRWRCAIKLGHRTIPALVQDPPTELENLVLMYNIHALREQWDYFTIASKLERMLDLYVRENGYTPNERELSQLTGLTVGAIRRCQLLINIPERYKNLLMEELEKPKSQQKISEDFLIEMERALKAVTRRIPEYSENLDEVRDALIAKFREGTIAAITDFRQLSKIATAIDKLGLAHQTAKRTLDKVFAPGTKYGIRQAFAQTVEFEYFERKAARDVTHLIEFINAVIQEERVDELDGDTLSELRELDELIRDLLSEVGAG